MRLGQGLAGGAVRAQLTSATLPCPCPPPVPGGEPAVASFAAGRGLPSVPQDDPPSVLVRCGLLSKLLARGEESLLEAIITLQRVALEKTPFIKFQSHSKTTYYCTPAPPAAAADPGWVDRPQSRGKRALSEERRG